eukprot:scpid5903/ scgid31309/ 
MTTWTTVLRGHTASVRHGEPRPVTMRMMTTWWRPPLASRGDGISWTRMMRRTSWIRVLPGLPLVVVVQRHRHDDPGRQRLMMKHPAVEELGAPTCTRKSMMLSIASNFTTYSVCEGIRSSKLVSVGKQTRCCFAVAVWSVSLAGGGSGDKHAGQPVLRFLRVWCGDQSCSFSGSRENITCPRSTCTCLACLRRRPVAAAD